MTDVAEDALTIAGRDVVRQDVEDEIMAKGAAQLKASAKSAEALGEDIVKGGE